MTENQFIEYKQSWHDDHLKWICGFANASGGTLLVGVNDDGGVTGVEDFKRLADIQTSDIVGGNLFQQIDQTLSILKTKYLLSPITYEGI